MAPVVSTIRVAVSEEDGDLGDPRGVLELTATPREERTARWTPRVISCGRCGLQLIVRLPEPGTTRSAPGTARLDSMQRA